MAGLEPLRIDERLTLPSHELEVRFARSGGPGGQNVNKVETKVILVFDLERSSTLSSDQRQRLREKLATRITARGEIAIHADRHRTRERNLADARDRMATLLGAALVRPKPRTATRPTRASRHRRLEGKRMRSEVKRRRRGSDE
jgi:ribosome-associated protein